MYYNINSAELLNVSIFSHITRPNFYVSSFCYASGHVFLPSLYPFEVRETSCETQEIALQ